MYTGPDDQPTDPDTSTPHAVWRPGLVVDQEFVQEHRPFLRRTLLRLGMAASDVDDGIQEVLVAAVTGAERFEAGRSPRAWLYGIAVNIARSQRRRRHRFGHAVAVPPEISVPPEQERRLESKAARSLIHRALDELPEEQRDVLVLHRLEGWPINVVAEAVGCPVATAHSRLRLGTARLGRVVRGNVARGRWTALMAALASALGWPPAAAAATAAAMLVVGTWATVATLSDSEVPGDDTPSVSRPGPVTVARAATRAEVPVAVPPEPEAMLQLGSAVVDTSASRAAPPPAGDARHASTVETPSASAIENGRAAENSSAGGVDDHRAALGPRAETVSAQPPSGTTQPAEVVPPTRGTVLEETQLLGRARTIAMSSPETARQLLQRYDARFPNGQLRRERDAIAALLGE